jgi:hypothetical protein
MNQDPLCASVAGIRAAPGDVGAASEQLAATLAPGMEMTSNETCKENLIPIKGFHG